MTRGLLLGACLLLLPVLSARAILVSGSYLSTSTLPGSAVTANGVSVADYVGTVNGASGVYLGNGWVVSAAHVGVGDGSLYSLDGYSYSVVAGSETAIGTGTDLVMFQISSADSGANATLSQLGSLGLAASSPAQGSSVLMIGYGAGGTPNMQTWGTSTVAEENQTVTPDGTSYHTTDFLAYAPPYDAYVVPGDSGGAAFVLSGGSYVLAGILEAQLTITDNGDNVVGYGSAAMDLTAYRAEIAATVPEPGAWTLLASGGALLLLLGRVRLRRA